MGIEALTPINQIEIKKQLDKKNPLIYTFSMEAFIDERITQIKESVLKFVPARYIYLFGSYAYGNPTEKSDIDVYIVTPDNVSNFSELYGEIIGDLSDKKIFFIDLSMNTESVFDARKIKNIFEKTIHQKGKIIYGH